MGHSLSGLCSIFMKIGKNLLVLKKSFANLTRSRKRQIIIQLIRPQTPLELPQTIEILSQSFTLLNYLLNDQHLIENSPI